MTIETLSTVRSHGGTQGVYKHASTTTGTDMTFAVFVPDHEPGAKLPVLWYLSGLTCTHANVMEKGEYRAACAEHGVRAFPTILRMPGISGWARDFTSMRPRSRGRRTTGCGPMSRMSCRR